MREELAAFACQCDFVGCMQDPKQRLTMPRVMKHAWVTKRGQWPLRTVRETLRAGDAIGADDEPELPDFMSTLNVLDVPRAVRARNHLAACSPWAQPCAAVRESLCCHCCLPTTACSRGRAAT